MNAAELELHKEGTIAFILADAEEIHLTRRTRIGDGAGGFKYTNPVPLIAQTGRMIPQSDRVQEVIDSTGRTVKPEYVLLLQADGDLQRYDTFTWRGAKWEVAQVHTKPDYELKGDVVRVG